MSVRIHIKDRLLKLHDGPTLEALNGLMGHTIHLPDRTADRADRERLAMRFEQFGATT
jgi:putative restriction endonuclease